MPRDCTVGRSGILRRRRRAGRAARAPEPCGHRGVAHAARPCAARGRLDRHRSVPRRARRRCGRAGVAARCRSSDRPPGRRARQAAASHACTHRRRVPVGANPRAVAAQIGASPALHLRGAPATGKGPRNGVRCVAPAAARSRCDAHHRRRSARRRARRRRACAGRTRCTRALARPAAARLDATGDQARACTHLRIAHGRRRERRRRSRDRRNAGDREPDVRQRRHAGRGLRRLLRGRRCGRTGDAPCTRMARSSPACVARGAVRAPRAAVPAARRAREPAGSARARTGLMRAHRRSIAKPPIGIPP